MKKQPKLLSLCLVMLLLWQSIPLSQGTTLATPSLVASGGIVMDASTGRVLFEKNADTKFYPGSMTKVMTAYIIFEEIYRGNISYDTLLTITPSQAALSTNSSYPTNVPLISGRQVSVDMLLKLILLPSASASCIVMAEHISGSQSAFVQRMNETAKRLGMDMTYTNVYGASTHSISPRSQAILLRAFLQQFPEVLGYTSLRSVTYNGYTYSNTNHLLEGSYYPYAGADGFKTGTASGSYNLSATAMRDGVRLVAVVMKSNNNANRHTDTAKLLDYGFALMASGEYYYDMWQYPQAAKYYEAFRQKNMIVLCPNGWAEPHLPTTKGEFAVLFLGALEAYTSLSRPATMPYASESPLDIDHVYGSELIQRGVAYGILPLDNGYFYPEAVLTEDYVQAIFARAEQYLGLRSASDTLGAVMDLEEITWQTQGSVLDGLTTAQREKIQIVLPLLPAPRVFTRFLNSLVTGEDSQPQPESQPETETNPYNPQQLLRGDAVCFIGSFLEDHGYL